MSYLSGLKIPNSNLNWMEPIFKNWVECNDRYQRLHIFDDPSDDTLFFYQERASVGTLAAAAWMVDDGYAVLEYGATKRRKVDLRTKGTGREDLYIGIDNEAIRLEAKFEWIDGNEILANGTLGGKIDGILESAKEDAARNEEYETPLGGMAIAKFYAEDENEESLRKICDVRAVVKEVKKVAKRVEASVWFFDTDGVWDGYEHYFGTALFISRI